MELRHLRYFEAVAEHLNFGRAAEALATAQPSLSRQILQLEDELGVTLFDRTNRRVELTDAGRMFLIDAKRTLQAADAATRHARENAEGTRGELRIGFVGGGMLVQLPAVLREYRRRYPHVDIVPYRMQYLEHYAALRAGTIDLAWTVAMADPEIEAQVVRTDTLFAVIPAGHPLAARTRIDLAEFAGEEIVTIAHSVAPRLHEATMELCLAHGFRPTRVHEVPEEVSVLGFVAAGFGVAIAPSPWAQVNIPGLLFRPLTTEYKVNEVLCWHRDRRTPIVRAFVQTALDLPAIEG
jgi:DNA-binding transcriptional LysR family regulator